MTKREQIYQEIEEERQKQIRMWGDQDLPMVTRSWDFDKAASIRESRKQSCDQAYEFGRLTWYHVLQEEIAEVFAEVDPDKQRAELVQVAAVAIQAIENLDRKAGLRDERSSCKTLAEFKRVYMGAR